MKEINESDSEQDFLEQIIWREQVKILMEIIDPEKVDKIKEFKIALENIQFALLGYKSCKGYTKKVYIDNFEMIIQKNLSDLGILDSIAEVNMSTDLFNVKRKQSIFKKIWYTFIREKKRDLEIKIKKICMKRP